MNIKICGVTRPEDAAFAAEAGAWAVSVIFSPRSPRFVTAGKAIEILKAVPKGVLRAGVFFDQSLDVIRRVEAEVPLDLIQLHGRESGALCESVGRDRCIKAVFLADADSVGKALEYPCGFLLVDRLRLSSGPEGKALFVSPELANSLARKKEKTLLAGGLTPETVGAAVRAVRPWGVDVASGVEDSPGVKNRGRIRAFIAAAQRAEEESHAA